MYYVCRSQGLIFAEANAEQKDKFLQPVWRKICVGSHCTITHCTLCNVQCAIVHCAIVHWHCALSHVSFFRLRTLQSLEIPAKPGSGRRRRQGWSTGSQVPVTLNLKIAKCICPNRPGSRNHKFIFTLRLFSPRSPWAFLLQIILSFFSTRSPWAFLLQITMSFFSTRSPWDGGSWRDNTGRWLRQWFAHCWPR